MKNKILVRMCLVILLTVFSIAACKSKKPSLSLEQTSFSPGEGITVKYIALPEYDSNAWIGIIPAGIPHGSETENDRHDIAYKYLKKSTSGSMTFNAPRKPGKYDFRMHNTDSGGVEVASITFEVIIPKAVAQEATQPKTRETQTKSKFNVGERVLVEWKGSWWPAEVIMLKTGGKPYKIHYDGYSSSWDEWVSDRRIKKKQ